MAQTGKVLVEEELRRLEKEIKNEEEELAGMNARINTQQRHIDKCKEIKTQLTKDKTTLEAAEPKP